ncbi:T-complex protein 1 subunit zeta-2 [Otolemur garnettii]|uniref:T-complex protein 1 subunit zeta-2 n=1 Tax=Otolemur garnettii TaxID=30611 RepID=UPI00064479B6|nr:T-complex protein 1 subunit zeta-2 [Otolemur garnettii]
MAAIKAVNAKAEVARAQAALAVNICAARGLQDVLRTNLGPKGTMKMLVSGAGDIKLTKDGNVLLHEMGLHPRIIAEGLEVAKIKALEVLEEIKVQKDMERTILLDVARTSLQTKVHVELADILTEVAQNLHAICFGLIRGLVLDHGVRHPDMKKRVEDAFILTCNVSLEYEKTEVSSGFFYKTAEEKEKLVKAERKFIDNRVQKIIDLKDRVCAELDKGFVVINQKGIDPFSLDTLAKHGIVALRRAKRRNMERLSLACGGIPVNSLEDLHIDCLGHADLVYEYTLGAFQKVCLRGCVVPGAGAAEVAIAEALLVYKHSIKGRARLGVQAFADALLIIPKVLAQNSGYDPQETLVKVQAEHLDSKQLVGIDLNTGEPMVAADAGVWDNYCVKKQLLHSCTVIATNILLVDEIMRAGMSSLKG